jgi:hypothetical protein
MIALTVLSAGFVGGFGAVVLDEPEVDDFGYSGVRRPRSHRSTFAGLNVAVDQVGGVRLGQRARDLLQNVELRSRESADRRV